MLILMLLLFVTCTATVHEQIAAMASTAVFAKKQRTKLYNWMAQKQHNYAVMLLYCKHCSK